jgi:hypothetical protein
MFRVLLASVVLVSVAHAGDPPDPVARAIGVQKAVADARAQLKAAQPGMAAATLEAQLPNADGGKEFLELLGQAYLAELDQLRAAPTPDETRMKDVGTRLAALGLTPAPATKPVTDVAPPDDTVGTATGLFKKSDFAAAAKLFEKAFLKKIELRPDQVAAWAYCRVKVAADRLNQPSADAAVARAVEKEVTEALALAPNHEGLQKAGQDVLAAARKRSGGSSAPIATSTSPLPAGWEAVESASFRVRHQGNKALAEAVAAAAEAKRTEIYSRWSGPPRGSWVAKCEVVLHPGTAAFAAATKQPAGATGLATVKIDDGAVADRRIDLRADDPTAATDALPRELTHVVLADLFPTQAPPRWAEEAMAVLAASGEEVGRYEATAATVARTQELMAVPDLVALTGFPKPEKVTGFYASSVTLVEYLVKLRGEKAFTTFLRDSQRYGMEAALRRNYDTDARTLDTAWRQAVLAGR